MSRKLTRKSVALGAGISLLASGLFAAPAFAAAGVESDSQGTAGVFGMVEGTSFKLLVNGNSEFPAGNAGLLRVHVKNLNGQTASDFRFSTTNANNVAVDGVYDSVDDGGGEDERQPGNLIITGAGAAKASTDASIAATVDAVAVMGLGVSTNGTANAPDNGSTSVMTSPFTFSFTSTAAAGTPAVYEVTAFVDTNNNAVMDAGEMKAPTRNVTFYDQTDLTATVTLDPMLEGDAQITGYGVINNVDMKQISADRVGIWLEDINGSSIGTGGNLVVEGITGTDGAGDSELEYNSTTKRYEFKTDNIVNDGADSLAAVLVAGKGVRANLLLDTLGESSPVVGDKITTTGSGTIASRTSGSIAVDTVDSETTTAIASTTSNVADVDVLLNSSYAVKAIVKNGDGAALAGKTVTAKVTSSRTLTSSITVSVNGTKYTSNAALPGATGVAKVSLTTDSKGEVVVNLTTAGLTDGDDVTVEFTVDNRVISILTDNVAADYTAFITNALNAVGTTDGAAASLSLSVRDQFGGKPANNTLRIVSTFDSGGTGYSAQTGGASTTASNSFADVVGGEATLSILDNGTGAGVNTYDLTLKTLAADGSYSASENVAGDFQVQVRTAANLAVGTLTVGSADSQNATTKVYTQSVTGQSANLFLADLFAHNSRTSLDLPPAEGNPGAGADGVVDGETVSGVVSTTGSAIAAATPIPGVAVTISGAGLMFKTTDQNSTTRYAVGSITVRTDKDGAYSVVVYSNKAGKQTLTVSAASQTASVVLDAFDQAAANSGDTLTVVAPKSIKSGKTLTVTARLVDEWGNPVAVPNGGGANPTATLTYAGPGFTTTGITQTLDANGESTFRVLVGTLDTGVATTTLTYDADGTTATIAAVSASKSVWVGPIANAKAGAKAGRVIVEAYRAKGKTVNVFVGSTRVASFVADKANFSAVVRGVKSGTRNVSVRLSGPGEDFRGAITVK